MASCPQEELVNGSGSPDPRVLDDVKDGRVVDGLGPRLGRRVRPFHRGGKVHAAALTKAQKAKLR